MTETARGTTREKLTEHMRTFTDPSGREWRASAREEPGPDYKGRFYMVLLPASGADGQVLELPEVRWNSERTARRTLETMSVFELRRRLRWAQNRVASRAAGWPAA